MGVVKIAAVLFAVLTVFVGLLGVVSPDTLIAIRRSYYATPSRFYTGGMVRVAMGLIVILAASNSRWPKALRALGTVVCLQGLAATLVFGLEHARTIMEWETMQGTILLRSGALVALASGVFIAIAVLQGQSELQRTDGLARHVL